MTEDITPDWFYNLPVIEVDTSQYILDFLGKYINSLFYGHLVLENQTRVEAKEHEYTGTYNIKINSIWFDGEPIILILKYSDDPSYESDYNWDTYITNEEGYRQMFSYLFSLVYICDPIVDKDTHVINKIGPYSISLIED